MSGPSFQYGRAANVPDALIQASRPGAAFLAGGTDLLQLWKAGAIAPAGVVDISHLPLDHVEFVDGQLSLGALARLSDVATHPDVTRYHPLIAKAILASASGQIRNMATVGGNLLQRTRCPYFRNEGLACNKRIPGSGCGALAGENRQAALFGASASCVATHASDLAVALTALDAEVEVFGAEGQRHFPLRDLYRLPAETPERETNLIAGELVTRHSHSERISLCRSFDLSQSSRSCVVRIRRRIGRRGAARREWQDRRGGIGRWRRRAAAVAAQPGAKRSLVGRAPDAQAIAAAGDMAVEHARPLAHNGFKIALLRNAVIRALQTVGGQP